MRDALLSLSLYLSLIAIAKLAQFYMAVHFIFETSRVELGWLEQAE